VGLVSDQDGGRAIRDDGIVHRLWQILRPTGPESNSLATQQEGHRARVAPCWAPFVVLAAECAGGSQDSGAAARGRQTHRDGYEKGGGCRGLRSACGHFDARLTVVPERLMVS
jgi:hypothetical protein